MKQARTLNCASCGAAVSSESPVCGHCGARVATMACGSCFQMMFEGSKFCPSCGAPAIRWEAGPADRPCPTCDQPLCHGSLGESTLHQCEKCFGFWVDRATFERICRHAENQTVAPGVTDLAKAPAAGPAKIRYVRCPECRAFMNRINFAECSGVVVDVCREHGTWFDAQELHRIVQFIRTGGMHESRRRQQAELATERFRLQAERRAIEGQPHDVPDSDPFGGPAFPDVIRAIGGLLKKHFR